METYMETPRSLVNHLHGEHDLHSPVIPEPFVFISCSLLYVARPLCRVFILGVEKGFQLSFGKFVTVSRARGNIDGLFPK